ncbi:uncharacterized protein V1510DRAFT_428226 [Dipodascopsis tothii]|uniref:uncharacterized protein n=1 Tax=Dipodascopsis tothii TaxID=44089 RepID=UPI0034CEE425
MPPDLAAWATPDRWNLHSRPVPRPLDTVTSIDVYDFDNTLFLSPSPNPALFDQTTIGRLQVPDVFSAGGWWHNECTLRELGRGFDDEIKRQWRGYWNEAVAAEVARSVADPGTLTILLTGRGRARFGSIVEAMVNSRAMAFDMLVLKPTELGLSTLNYKNKFMETTILACPGLRNVRMFEDRGYHVREFNVALARLQKDFSRRHGQPFQYSVRLIKAEAAMLDPARELRMVQRMVREQNDRASRDAGGAALATVSLAPDTQSVAFSVAEESRQALLDLALAQRAGDGSPLPFISLLNVGLRTAENTLTVIAAFNKARAAGHEPAAVTEFAVVAAGLYADAYYAVRIQPDVAEDAGWTTWTDFVNPVVLVAANVGAAECARLSLNPRSCAISRETEAKVAAALQPVAGPRVRVVCTSRSRWRLDLGARKQRRKKK